MNSYDHYFQFQMKLIAVFALLATPGLFAEVKVSSVLFLKTLIAILIAISANSAVNYCLIYGMSSGATSNNPLLYGVLQHISCSFAPKMTLTKV